MDKKLTEHNTNEKYIGMLEQKIQYVKREYRSKKEYTKEDYDSINFCGKCGSKVSRVYSFCSQCGTFHDEFNFREPSKKKN
ncbi:MAG TPA: hypothetical protein VJR22_04355 [Candidatus Nitrosotalea sp.]|nr:hypothetical protein [Nitrososphaerota archaeon]HKU33057.1 hypothetical protein [Candidatus Nitrosotalea sp.]